MHFFTCLHFGEKKIVEEFEFWLFCRLKFYFFCKSDLTKCLNVIFAAHVLAFVRYIYMLSCLSMPKCIIESNDFELIDSESNKCLNCFFDAVEHFITFPFPSFSYFVLRHHHLISSNDWLKSTKHLLRKDIIIESLHSTVCIDLFIF